LQPGLFVFNNPELTMAKYDFDLFVIGGGSGGVRAGRVAASLGKRVGIAEEYRFGGTCVIRGCVPKKLFVYASQYREHFRDAAGFGWTVGDTSFDWGKFIAAKDKEIARLEGLYRKGLETNGAQIFESRAVLEGPHEVRILKEDRLVTAERILIATGGAPRHLRDVEGGELSITSNEIFHLESQPESIVIDGAGYIGIEFACILSGLGTKVTLIMRGEEILRGFDDDIRAALRNEMVRNGIDVRPHTRITKIAATPGGGRLVTLSDGSTLEASLVMQAVGRLPNTQGLGLEKAGVHTGMDGAVVVDEYSRSNAQHILAVGDVTNRVQLTPVAIHEAMCLIETEFRGNPTSPDHELIPTAVFSQPEIGTIGMTETQAAIACDAVTVYFTKFRPMKNTISGNEERMVMKIIVDDASDRVVGVHILGPDAGEMIQALAIAIKMGATKADFDRTMALHPSAAEELVTHYTPSWRLKGGERV
jgi:glutathione reductase (NADPH)